MPTYIFILGNNSELSLAELKAVLPAARFFINGKTYVQCEMENEIDCARLLRQLGGTIKIGKVMCEKVDQQAIVGDLLKSFPGGRVVFGVSYYNNSQFPIPNSQLKFKCQNIGMGIKKTLGEAGRSSRFVTSREKVLSSVVVTKNKCQEYMILDNTILAKTCAVQEFEEYSERDYGRPARDAKSGMLPPKLAKIMINLSQAKHDDIVIDPFCGSGTILQEAIVLGYKFVIGCDISEKAVEDSKKNLEWLSKNFQFPISNFQLFVLDVKKLSSKIGHADVIVTEPYLGPALRGNETREDIFKIKTELERLYLDAFKEFSKIVKNGGRIVFVVPAWIVGAITDRPYIRLNIEKKIQELGFRKISTEELLYSRPDQRVAREIMVFQKK